MKQLPSYNRSVFNDVLTDIIRSSLIPLEPVPAGIKEEVRQVDGIRALLFDVYGTLLISETGDIAPSGPGGAKRQRVDAAEAALTRSGFVLNGSESGEAAFDSFIREIRSEHARLKAAGIDVPEVEIRSVWKNVLSGLARDGMISGPVDEASASLTALRFELATNRIWPMPGADTLFRFIKAGGLPAGIVSNAQFYTPLTFKALFSSDEEELGFDPNLIAYSYKLRRAKPSPGTFQPLLERLSSAYGIAPGEVLYIGNDMKNDIYTARYCGCRTVLFAGDARSLRLRSSDPDCRELKPDAVITSLEQIPALLGL